MKKILLATTILGMSAGYAAAQVSWSASAAAGIASDFGDDLELYSSLKLGVKASAETDSGLTFSAITDMTVGTSFDRGADLGDDGIVEEDATFGMPTIAISGAFGTVSFSDDNYDFYDDTTSGGDIKYEGTFGAINVGVISDIDDGDFSVKLGYTAEGLAVSADVSTYDNELTYTNASVAYTMGAITGTLSTRYDGYYDDQVSTVKLAYSADGISASISANDNENSDEYYEDDDFTLAAGYTANNLTIGAEYSYDAYYDESYTKVTGSYDLGAGLTLEAGADSDENAYLGAAMKF